MFKVWEIVSDYPYLYEIMAKLFLRLIEKNKFGLSDLTLKFDENNNDVNIEVVCS